MSADLPQLASPHAGRDLAAAAQLLHGRRNGHGAYTRAVERIDQVLDDVDELPTAAVALHAAADELRTTGAVAGPVHHPVIEAAAAEVVDLQLDIDDAAQLLDQAADAAQCLCEPGLLCDEGRCAFCAALDPELPCPHDTFVDEAAARFATVHAAAVDDYAQLAGQLVDHDEVTIVTPELAAAVLDEPELPAVDWSAVADRPLAEVAGVVDQVVIEPPASRPSTGHFPTLDWRSRHDPRSLAYGARARGLASPAVLADVDLDLGPTLDQGPDGECVGYALTTAINALTLTHDADIGSTPRVLDDQVAQVLYARAQRLDDRPGEDYSGTSVLAGCQAAVEAGLIGGYLWDFGTRDIALTLMRRRPVVVGIPMLSGMFDTGPDGIVRVEGEPTGTGHALAIVSLRLKGPAGQPGPWFRWQNSWGTGYGDHGIGWVHHRDLAALLRGQGEAAVPMIEAQS